MYHAPAVSQEQPTVSWAIQPAGDVAIRAASPAPGQARRSAVYIRAWTIDCSDGPECVYRRCAWEP